MKADFSKDNSELTLTLTTPDYMAKETAEKLKPSSAAQLFIIGRMEFSLSKISILNFLFSLF